MTAATASQSPPLSSTPKTKKLPNKKKQQKTKSIAIDEIEIVEDNEVAIVGKKEGGRTDDPLAPMLRYLNSKKSTTVKPPCSTVKRAGGSVGSKN